jgi:type IV/VI secretion system ImpK/VasF family protein
MTSHFFWIHLKNNFYALLYEYISQIEADSESSSRTDVTLELVTSKKLEASKISQNFIVFLQEDAQKISFQEGSSLYPLIQYAWAGLIDEIFLNISWSDQKSWYDCLIEERLFFTQKAGDKIFDDMQEHLKLEDPFFRPLLEVYLEILGIGFLGKYRCCAYKTSLLDIKYDIFEHLYSKKPSLKKYHQQITDLNLVRQKPFVQSPGYFLTQGQGIFFIVFFYIIMSMIIFSLRFKTFTGHIEKTLKIPLTSISNQCLFFFFIFSCF